MAQQKLPMAWTASTPTASVAAGGSFKVEVAVRIEEGWHLYALTQTAPPDPTRITVPDGQPFTLGGKIEAPAPEAGFDTAQGADTEYYEESVTFRVPVSVSRSASPGKQVAHVRATWQACNGSICLRPQITNLDVAIQVSAPKQ